MGEGSLITTADYQNSIFMSALDLNTIRENIRSMSPKKAMELIELSEYAVKAIAGAILELESGSCKTFSSIDELLEDLVSD